MRTRIFIRFALCLVLLPFGLLAQVEPDSTPRPESYQDFKENAIEEYNKFKAQAFSEYERFLAEAWKEYQAFAGKKSAFAEPKPESIPALKISSGADEDETPSKYRSVPLPSSEHPDDALITPQDSETVSINFYGCKLNFQLSEKLRVKAKSTKERDISRYHETMRKSDVDQSLSKQLDATVSRLGLNEWGYFALLRSLSEKTFTKMDDRVLFCFYMLHSHGFKARVGRGQRSGPLILLLALDNSKEVYSKTFFRINGTKFYAVYGGTKDENVYSYDEKADDSGLKEIALDFKQPLNMRACDRKRILHLDKANLDIELPYSTSHLRYYDDVPMTEFPIYVKSAISNEAEQALTETFGTLAEKTDKTQRVDLMLNFVQTAFAYKIDEKQFGREKYFFPEEVIGYPFSDCEDRCALFAWLVRHYTDYDVIGILYADHLATAVCFGDDAQPAGKSLTYKGKNYVICDPTYENAPIGTLMPKYNDAKFEIIELN